MKRELIENWIKENGPYGQEKLSVKAELGFDTVGSAKRGRVPVRSYVRRKLADAIGVAEEVLFPSVGADKEAAS